MQACFLAVHLRSLSDEEDFDGELDDPADAMSEHLQSLSDEEDLDAELAFEGVPVPVHHLSCQTAPRPPMQLSPQDTKQPTGLDLELRGRQVG